MNSHFFIDLPNKDQEKQKKMTNFSASNIIIEISSFFFFYNDFLPDTPEI